MTRLFAPLLLLVVMLSSAFAQSQSLFDQMHDLLDRGYYYSAARVVGPSLVEGHPADPAAHFLYSQALYLIGEFDLAGAELQTAIELGGDASEPGYSHLAGLLAAADGDLDSAARLLRNAFIRSNSYEHAMDWGRIAWQAYRLEEALLAYEAAAATPDGESSPWPHLNRGRLLQFLGRVDEAVEAYREAIEVFEQHDTGEARPSPAYVEAYFRLGEIYERQGDEQGSNQLLRLAMDHYRAALTGDPNYAPAIEALDSLSRRIP